MSRASELANIRKILGRFNIADYEKHVISCFPSELQEIARQKLTKKTKKIMVYQLTRVIGNERRKSLETIHLRLCAVCVSLHSERRNWRAYEMKNSKNVVLDVQRLHGKLLQGCRLNNLECDIDIVKYKDILWFTFIEKIVKRNRGIVRGRPIFCAHILGTPYIFCSGVLQKDIGEVLLHAFSFRSIADLNLIGRDIKSLHTILIRKEGGVASLTTPNYKVQKPRTIFGSRDYSQHENRKEFAGKCFPVDAKIETLCLTNETGSWRGNLEIDDGEDLELRWVVKLSSPNIFSTLKEFCEKDLIEPEHAAAYAVQLGKEGKTTIKVPVIPLSGHVND